MLSVRKEFYNGWHKCCLYGKSFIMGGINAVTIRQKVDIREQVTV